jgi:hypothetical protein
MVVLVEARGVADDTTRHEAGYPSGWGAEIVRVDQDTFMFHIGGTLEEFPVELAELDQRLSQGHAFLGL